MMMPAPRTMSTWKSLYPPMTSDPYPLSITDGNMFGRYPKQSSAQVWNMMVSDNCLVPTPGYKFAAKILPTQNGGRALYNSTQSKRMYSVIENGLFSIDSNLSVARLGSLETFVGPVSIEENLAGEIAISDGLNIYVFNYRNNTFAIATIDFLPGRLAYQDTYIIANVKNTNQWRLSEASNAMSWPSDAQHNSGEIQTKTTFSTAPIALNRQLYIFGETVCEPWYDAGYTLFPYQRSNSVAIDYGCVNPSTIAINGGDTEQAIIVWLASNEKSGVVIMAMVNENTIQLSNDGINYVLNHLSNPNDSVAFMYRIDGHLFYHITFISDNLTYIYDFTTKKFFTLTDYNYNYHPAQSMVFFNNKYYFTSLNDGNLYEMDSETYTYNNQEIPRIIITDSIRLKTNARFRLGNITLTMESGNNRYYNIDKAITTQVVDLSISYDGGQTFNSIERKVLNSTGQTQNIVQWFPQTSGNDITPRFTFWAKDRFVVEDAIAQVNS